MTKSRLALRVLSMLVFSIAIGTIANAQATRTWVSGVGDDVNPCSRTAPCKTFAGAISKTATNGEINALDPAGYGAVTITKSITINCVGTTGTILAAGTNGIIINITGSGDAQKSVRIRGLDINGGGTGVNGIRILSAATVHIEDSLIDGFTQNGISVESSAATQVVVRNTTIRNTGTAVSLKSSGSSLTISDSSVAGNRTGISSDGAEANVDRTSVLYNATGILANAGSTIRFSNATIIGNKTGFTVNGGTLVSFKNNAITGNGGKDPTFTEVSPR